MNIKKTPLKDCFILKPAVFGDGRGYFFESFNKKKFKKLTGLNIDFVQDNESFSNRGVIRGLHFQTGEWAQAKLVRVIRGKVLDVAVDIRKNSPTYGKHFSIELSGENKLQLFIPRGFAHGFSVLKENTIVSYKCDNYYNKESESGIFPFDSDLDINWGLLEHEAVLSKKDKLLPSFKDYINQI